MTVPTLTFYGKRQMHRTETELLNGRCGRWLKQKQASLIAFICTYQLQQFPPFGTRASLSRPVVRGEEVLPRLLSRDPTQIGGVGDCLELPATYSA